MTGGRRGAGRPLAPGAARRARATPLAAALVVAALLLVAALVACKGGNAIEAGLRADATFDASTLPPDARVWYDRFWTALRAPGIYPNSLEAAATGDLYQIGRVVNVHVSTLLQVFRLTGDLALLDEVDKPMQVARSTLRDTNGDGYLNWTWLHDPDNSQWYGDDYHTMDEDMTHGLVAAVAWAYRQNRDQVSPGGVDYAERADFWLGYLKDDFEPKWRARSRTTGYDYLYTELMHPYLQTVRYFHYMGLLTGDDGYTAEAQSLADALKDEFLAEPTDSGPAFVWGQGIQGEDSYVHYFQPTIYAAYTVQTVLELASEGMEPFASTEFLTRLARGIATFVIDNGATDFAVDVGGQRPFADLAAAPLPPHDPGYDRLTSAQWGIMPFGSLAPFDASGKVAEVSAAVYAALERGQPPRRIYLPAASFISALLEGR